MWITQWTTQQWIQSVTYATEIDMAETFPMTFPTRAVAVSIVPGERNNTGPIWVTFARPGLSGVELKMYSATTHYQTDIKTIVIGC